MARKLDPDDMGKDWDDVARDDQIRAAADHHERDLLSLLDQQRAVLDLVAVAQEHGDHPFHLNDPNNRGYCACGAKLCTHHRRDLRGCLLDAGHAEPHTNPTAPGETWTDAEGSYIDSREDWVALIDRLSGGGGR